jgi:hypothetical protein
MGAQGSDAMRIFYWQLLHKFDEADYSQIWELAR